MANTEIEKFRLKGNASFSIREGWLSKGLQHVAHDPEVFLREEATEILGVGSAMVKSIRFWMIAAGLTTEPAAGRRKQTLTGLGNLILKEDKYFEDYFTLNQVHYHLATDPIRTTVWYLLFNYYSASRFRRTDMEESLKAIFEEMTAKEYSLASFRDDCSTALRTYVADQDKCGTPEDNMQCPLISLGLFEQMRNGYYESTSPLKSKLPSQMVLYVILDQLGKHKENSISLERIQNDPCNVGKIFHLNAYQILGYLDELQAEGSVTLQRTAGLNMVYPLTKLSPEEIAERYYRRMNQ